MARRKWSKELLQIEALKFSSRGDFRKGSPNAYSIAQKKGILNQLCSHMKNKLTYWTKELLQAEALKYSSRNDFYKGSLSAYIASSRRNLLDEICKHMKNKLTYWTTEMLIDEANKYSSRSEFQKGSPSAYNIAWGRGILQEISSHMALKHKSWTIEMLIDESLKYSSRSDFKEGSSSAYAIACGRGILEQVSSHMEKNVGNRFFRWVYKSIDYTSKTIYIGLTYDLKMRLETHIKQSRELLALHIQEFGLIPVTDQVIPAQEAANLERKLIKLYRSKGWNVLNKSNGGEL